MQQVNQTQAAVKAEEAVQAAERALREAQAALDRASTEAARSGANAPRPERLITVPDGNGGTTRISIGTGGVRVDQTPFATTAPDFPIRRSRDIPRGVLDIVNVGATVLVAVVLGGPLARAFARWIDRRLTTSAPQADVSKRLTNIEQALETVAVEVERISEGQRFTTKLLADRAKEEARLL